MTTALFSLSLSVSHTRPRSLTHSLTRTHSLTHWLSLRQIVATEAVLFLPASLDAVASRSLSQTQRGLARVWLDLASPSERLNGSTADRTRSVACSRRCLIADQTSFPEPQNSAYTSTLCLLSSLFARVRRSLLSAHSGRGAQSSFRRAPLRDETFTQSFKIVPALDIAGSQSGSLSEEHHMATDAWSKVLLVRGPHAFSDSRRRTNSRALDSAWISSLG